MLSYHGAEAEAGQRGPDTQAVRHDAQQQQGPREGVDGDDGALLREETLGQAVAARRECRLRGAWKREGSLVSAYPVLTCNVRFPISGL